MVSKAQELTPNGILEIEHVGQPNVNRTCLLHDIVPRFIMRDASLNQATKPILVTFGRKTKVRSRHTYTIMHLYPWKRSYVSKGKLRIREM